MTVLYSSTDFLHPLDWAARQHLENVPMLRQATQKYMSYVADRRHRQMLLSHAVRLGPRQLPHIYRLLPPICEAFGITQPELFLMPGDSNAMTMGHSQTAIVVQNQLLEDLAEDEIQAVLAHECGHILAEHVLYRQMAVAIASLGQAAGSVHPALRAVTALAGGKLQSALLDWLRKSELTADRAAATFMGSPEPMQRAMFRICGVPRWIPGEVSFEEFAEQGREFEQISGESSKWDKALMRNLEVGMTHPFPTIRMKELIAWSTSDGFRQLLEIGHAHRDDRAPCAACGKRLDVDWRFCQHCGSPVTSDRPIGEVG